MGTVIEGRDGIEGSGEAALFESDGVLLLDMFPDEGDCGTDDWLQLHSALVLEVRDSLRFGMFEPDSIGSVEGELYGLVPFESEGRLILSGPAVNVLEALVRWAGRPSWTEWGQSLARDTTWSAPEGLAARRDR